MDALLDDYRRHVQDHFAHMVDGNADASNVEYHRLQDAACMH